MLVLVVILIILTILVYYYNVRNFDYWKKRGVKHDEPVFLFGTNAKNFLMQKSRTEITEDMYKKYPSEKVVGFFCSTQPELIIRDPTIIKKILTSDFLHFYSRYHTAESKAELMMHSLVFADGDLWKMLRMRMTPAFTSGKLRAMFPLIIERAEILQQRTMLLAKNNQSMDACELMARFTTDFIGACGFGLDSDSINDEDSEFRKLGRDLFNPSLKYIIIAVLKVMFPALCKNLKFYGFIEKRACELINYIQASRNYKPIGRNDFIDQILEYKQNGPIEIESIENYQSDGTPEKKTMELTNDLIIAQVMVFFGAGFETSSTATSYTLHELAYNPEVQEKVHNNIDEVLERHNNKLSYEAVKEMTYLKWALQEGLRIFPPVGFLVRECTRKYTFEDLNFSIDEGVLVSVSVAALHNDPQYWDNPEEFRPERFSNENFTNVQRDVYLAFGDGPRNCIGARFGIMTSLVGLAAILSKFTVKPAPESLRRPPVVYTSNIVQSVKALPLIFVKRK